MHPSEMTDDQLKEKLDLAEKLVTGNRDPKNQPTLNRIFEMLFDEDVRRSLERSEM